MAWHDTADFSLRQKTRAARECDGVWRLEPLAPGPDGAWLPGTPPPVLAEAITAARLGIATDALVEVARFTGREHSYALDGLDGVCATLLRGTVEAGDIREPACRLRLTGPPQGIEAACASLGEALGLIVPLASLPASALGVVAAPPGAAVVAADASLGEFVGAVLPSLVWPVLLGTAVLTAEISVAGIHETRVAVRRLRSVLGVLRRPLACAMAEALRPMLHGLAGRLGAARDWDVFLDGVGGAVAQRLGNDPQGARLLAAARRQRSAAYAALNATLNGPEQRALALQLTCVAALRPWEEALLTEGGAAFAAELLQKRLRRMRRAGRGFKGLPPAALHALRKDGKRLRYAAEAFAPLFPGPATRRFLKRLRAVQNALGEIQDAAVVSDLLARLGATGRGYAGGVAVGIAEGRGEALRAEARAAWRQLSRAEAFWA